MPETIEPGPFQKLTTYLNFFLGASFLYFVFERFGQPPLHWEVVVLFSLGIVLLAWATAKRIEIKVTPKGIEAELEKTQRAVADMRLQLERTTRAIGAATEDRLRIEAQLRDTKSELKAAREEMARLSNQVAYRHLELVAAVTHPG